MELFDNPNEVVEQPEAAEALTVATVSGHGAYDAAAGVWVMTWSAPVEGRGLGFPDDYEVLPPDEVVGMLTEAY